jgi:hypothetical protein
LRLSAARDCCVTVSQRPRTTMRLDTSVPRGKLWFIQAGLKLVG